MDICGTETVLFNIRSVNEKGENEYEVLEMWI